ncbi:hypothetical protein A6S26_18805 [Nostoc sp. ATCC 43529]|nr:hypothetical protein A6S26_18805 [Nostoc sp. ATCC 43529]
MNNSTKNSTQNSESRIQNAASDGFKTTINLVDDLNLFLLLGQSKVHLLIGLKLNFRILTNGS